MVSIEPLLVAGHAESPRCCHRSNGAQKLLGVLITIGEAVAYVVSGMYGDVRELGAGNAILIILQVLPLCRQAHLSGRGGGEGGVAWQAPGVIRQSRCSNRVGACCMTKQ